MIVFCRSLGSLPIARYSSCGSLALWASSASGERRSSVLSAGAFCFNLATIHRRLGNFASATLQDLRPLNFSVQAALLVADRPAPELRARLLGERIH